MGLIYILYSVKNNCMQIHYLSPDIQNKFIELTVRHVISFILQNAVPKLSLFGVVHKCNNIFSRSQWYFEIYE